jgi:hypothetical protein
MTTHRLRALLMPSEDGQGGRRESLLRALPYLISFAVVLLLVCSGASFWETNDDEHMAMIAHGYGITSKPSSGLVFSSVAWGWLVSHLGTIGGFQGYALGQYALLLLACGVIAHRLHVARVPGVVGAAVLLTMFPTAILETQFTITAGYLAVAAFAIAFTSGDGRTPWSWCGAATLLVLSALVRFNEFAFVCIVATPFAALMLWQSPKCALRLGWLGMLVGAGVAISASMAVDHAYYSGPEWQDFKQRTALAQPFVDYGLSDYYMAHKRRLQGSGLSVNDMLMLGQRAFMDEKVFNRGTLAPLIAGVSVRERAVFNLTQWEDAVRPFQAPAFDLLLAVLALVLAAGRPRSAAVAAALAVLAAMLFFWLWGRPGVVRIYLPAAAALAVLALVTVEYRRHTPVLAAGCVLAVAALWFGIQDFIDHSGESADAEMRMQATCNVPTDRLLVVWGAAGRYDREVYRPLAAGGAACPLQLYVVGGLELLPTAIEKLHAYTGDRSLIEALLDGQQMYFIGSPMTSKRLNLLSRFLSEHYGATLTVQRLGPPKGTAQYLVQAAR